MSDVAPDDFSQGHTVPQQVVAHTLGQRLAAERQARDWSIEYVAGQLNLAVRQIHALESDNYSALPGIASVRGFVRAYAKLLRIEADPLVALIAREQIVPNQPLEPKPNLSSTPFSHSRLSGGSGNNSNSVKGIAFALVVVLLAVAAIGVEHMGGWPTLSQSLANQFGELFGKGGSQPSTDGAASDAAKPSSESDASKDASASDTRDSVKETVTPPPTPEAQAPAQASSPEPATAAPAASAPAPTQSMPAAQPAAAPKTSNEPASASKPAAATGAGTLVLSARQNSWIDVRAGGNVIASHLLKAGDTETFEIPGAASLTIGNAAGVDATYRGQPLSGGTDGKSNVAHISLK